MSDERDLIANQYGALERLTVNLTPKAQAALRRACDYTGDSLTDSVNRAIQYYELMLTNEDDL